MLMRDRWIAFIASRGFTGNVLSEDAVKVAMAFAATLVGEERADVVAWLRAIPANAPADRIERGDHIGAAKKSDNERKDRP
jgi:hypothetical protein